MNRRDFVRLTATAAGTTALTEATVCAQIATSSRPAGPPPVGKALMKVGTQHGHTDAILQACAGFGVNNICSRLPSAEARRGLVGGWRSAGSRSASSRSAFRSTWCRCRSVRTRSRAPRVPRSCWSRRSGSADRRHLPDDPQRRAGRHHAGEIQPDVHRRSANHADAGAADRRATARSCTSSRRAGPAADDRRARSTRRLYWERITYFLERVVPVAEEYKVRIGCHPQDPGHAEGQGLARRRNRARVGGRPQALRLHQGEPVSRPELLPGHGVRDARETWRRDLRRHPLLRNAQEDFQRALQEHRRRLH